MVCLIYNVDLPLLMYPVNTVSLLASIYLTYFVSVLAVCTTCVSSKYSIVTFMYISNVYLPLRVYSVNTIS